MGAFDYGRKVDAAELAPLMGLQHGIPYRECIGEGWELFRAHVGEFLGFTLLVLLLSAAGSLLEGFGSFIFSALAAPLYAGYAIVAFRLGAGKPLLFSDFFRGFNYFLPLLLAGLASGMLVAAGMILLLLPGIYLAVGYFLTTFLVIDYRMEFWQAMETSRKIVTSSWFSFFGFSLLLFLLNLAGLLLLGVGLLVSLPVTSCAAAMAYRRVVGLHSTDW